MVVVRRGGGLSFLGSVLGVVVVEGVVVAWQHSSAVQVSLPHVVTVVGSISGQPYRAR